MFSSMNRSILIVVAALTACVIGLLPRDAQAFCGFYVSGADAKLLAEATQVVLMRDGTRTVLSMQNDYKGPPEGFAMVVPVPVVLQKENVKTLPRAVFDRIDKLSAPCAFGTGADAAHQHFARPFPSTKPEIPVFAARAIGRRFSTARKARCANCCAEAALRSYQASFVMFTRNDAPPAAKRRTRSGKITS